MQCRPSHASGSHTASFLFQVAISCYQLNPGGQHMNAKTRKIEGMLHVVSICVLQIFESKLADTAEE